MILTCWLGILLSGCLHQRTITTWKADYIILPVHKKIMVVGIIKDNNDSLRARAERIFVKNLNELGYNAVSALQEFGPKGLSNLGEADTYIRLCNNGIDAVLTFALLDQVKQTEYRPGKFSASTNQYYYTRIWNYKEMQANLSESVSPHGDYLWESILFDLNTLEPLSVIQTRPFKPGREKETDFIYQIVGKMRKEKILSKQDIQPLKPF